MKILKIPWNNLQLRKLEHRPKHVSIYEDQECRPEHFHLSGLVANNDLWHNQYYIGREYLQILINNGRSVKVIRFDNI